MVDCNVVRAKDFNIKSIPINKSNIPPIILDNFPYFVEKPVTCIVIIAIKKIIKSSNKKNNIYKPI